MCLSETYSRVRVGKHLFGVFPIKNGFKQGDALPPVFLDFAFECVIRKVQVNQEGLKLTLRLLMSYIYMEHLFLMFLDHTQRRSTVGRTPLNE